MKTLCMRAAVAITNRIERLCDSPDAVDSGIRELCKSLSTLDNIIYASREDGSGEKE